MTHSSFRPISAAAAALVLLSVIGCKKTSEPPADDQIASLLFDVSSPAAREALATPIDFRLTDENFAQWEDAQRFLDALPRSAFASATGSSGNPIDRAVATLEASPRARTAIERTGLTIRDFVLETIALAQAAEAESGKAAAGVNVPAENLQFIQRYRSRILRARADARDAAPADDYAAPDTTEVGEQSPIDVVPEVQQGSDLRASDSGNIGTRLRDTDSLRRNEQTDERGARPPADSGRDTIPPPIAFHPPMALR